MKIDRDMINNDRQFWNEEIETLPEEEMKALQWKRLKMQLQYNFENSVYYREEKFRKAGLIPDDIQTFEDFQKSYKDFAWIFRG